MKQQFRLWFRTIGTPGRWLIASATLATPAAECGGIPGRVLITGAHYSAKSGRNRNSRTHAQTPHAARLINLQISTAEQKYRNYLWLTRHSCCVCFIVTSKRTSIYVIKCKYRRCCFQVKTGSTSDNNEGCLKYALLIESNAPQSIYWGIKPTITWMRM